MSAHPVSPLRPALSPKLGPIAGVRLAAVECGIRYEGRVDLMLAELVPGTAIAGTFTRSKTAGAPVIWCQQILPHGVARAIVVNSGNANAFTGRRGAAGVAATVEAAARLLVTGPEEIYISSTGVIGEPLPAERIVDAMPRAIAALDAANWDAAASAIMTTDTFPKLATVTAEIDGVTVTLNGFCKGSGMIAPDMATMLGYVFTDAAIAAPALQSALAAAVDRSFNAITVDGDTSTSDTVLLAATAQAPHAPVTDPADPRLANFRAALQGMLINLAQQIIRDGEGATKFVSVTVRGAASDLAARRIGLSIGNSPLVKTAIAAGDANWGRIVAAVGKSGEEADRDLLGIHIGGIAVAAEGAAVSGYDETPVARHMAGQEIDIEVDLGLGTGEATIWTCDLTHGYIDINGSYRS